MSEVTKTSRKTTPKLPLDNEGLISLEEATKLVPSAPAVVTVWRWCRNGCRGLYLEHILLGRRMFTSEEAVGRFLAACNRVQIVG